MVELTSVGTLFAFVLVCAGILRLLEQRKKALHLGTADVIREDGGTEIVPESKFKTPYINGKWIVPLLFVITVACFLQYYPGGLSGFLDTEGRAGWGGVREKVPYILFGIVFFIISVLSFIRSYSLIPVLGFLCCSYLLCESGTTNWERFLIWLVAGLVIYFLYGRRKSKLNHTT